MSFGGGSPLRYNSSMNGGTLISGTECDDMVDVPRKTHEPILGELIAVLRPHAEGLRKWSVMRALRAGRHRSSQDVPQKFEEQIERTFRQFCADPSEANARICTA